MLKLAQRPTAIFAANDAMAIGALSALREDGLTVPHDVAVAGFDDIPIARYVSPPLSSVHVPIAQLGERAMELLLGAIAQPTEGSPRRVVLPTTLVIRKSSP
jgi:LacI family transcriptional regulator